MKTLSLVRGLVAALFPILALTIAAISGDLVHWIPVLIAAHLLVPVIAAFTARRADTLALDIALATTGLAYLVVMLLLPRGAWTGSTYVGVALAYAVYGVLAAAAFGSLATLRQVLRVQGWRRL